MSHSHDFDPFERNRTARIMSYSQCESWWYRVFCGGLNDSKYVLYFKASYFIDTPVCFGNEALKSIHDSYSRFVTVHGTHEATVKDVVGYNCNGHGFFLEDGYETENKERFRPQRTVTGRSRTYILDKTMLSSSETLESWWNLAWFYHPKEPMESVHWPMMVLVVMMIMEIWFSEIMAVKAGEEVAVMVSQFSGWQILQTTSAEIMQVFFRFYAMLISLR